MSSQKRVFAGFVLALTAGCGMAAPSPSLAAPVYTFNYTDGGLNPAAIVAGSFSIPVADFTAATPVLGLFGLGGDLGVSLPNTDITAISLTLNGSTTFGLADRNASGANVFDVSGAQPQLAYGTTNFLVVLPIGCNPEQTSCSSGIQAALFGNSVIIPAGLTDSFGTWNTSSGMSATPLPAALPLFVTGLGALGLLGWRRKRKNAASTA
jgi:hypothetical protein